MRHTSHGQNVAIQNVRDEFVRIGNLGEVLGILVSHANVVDEHMHMTVEGFHFLGNAFVD